MQKNDIAVKGNKITGTLKFIEGGIAQSGPLAGDGYFMALKFTDPDDDATSHAVGLVPTYGTGMVELDSDMNAVFKINDKDNQVLKVVSSNSDKITTKTYDLSYLKLSKDN